ncbi:lipoprotein [Aliarcobacter lanthieri]|uniref:lipoprotein n=1 Tax=Aliarcobacter lanthieri TaxID=1355374 RepID=UPI000479500F|nr:lipoprotein [Aliarcobacter lanthieri]QKF58223.1 hypothetical protein ALANTH_0082 [Aliarcobacter lanthieri]
MKNYIFIIFLTVFLSACSTKIDRSIEQSNVQDVSELILQLAEKEKEINDIIKELEQCNATKKREQ